MPDPEPHQFSKIAEELIGELRRILPNEPRRQKIRATQPVAEIIDQLVSKHQIGRDAPEQIIRENWVELVGSANASYSHAARLENNGTMLVVIAGHAVVRNELFHHRGTIIGKIRLIPGCREVKHLHLTAG